MKNTFLKISKYISYLRKAQSNLYIHSPFVFDFYNKLLKYQAKDENLKEIYNLRKKLKSKSIIEYDKLGSGMDSKKSMHELVSKVAVKHRFGKLLYSLCRYYGLNNIIELGTNIGVSTLYLSRSGSDREITTIEGSEKLHSIAKHNFEIWKCTNVSAVQGKFETKFEPTLQSFDKIDLIFFDGNHNKASTLEYFETALKYKNEKTIFIFDDIYWSAEMTEAWEEIKSNDEIVITIDLFQFGLAFFDKAIKVKQDFTLYY